MSTIPLKEIDTFPNPNPERSYSIRIKCPEFTCLCPLTGQPDFAHIELEYIPDEHCVELKSLKLYLWGFRDQGAFHEAVTNQISDHLIEKLNPRYLSLSAAFSTRGGIDTTVTVVHGERKVS
ncbi:NADPH-dependent 7-cyano-7-deazaguanine reductase QueF [bacterium]|jgi:7-cyano-7-deazaguanine reductase|nr:NADPH-dependent 7-cyano-7-deazaguanine reductase QueF [bacterium]